MRRLPWIQERGMRTGIPRMSDLPGKGQHSTTRMLDLNPSPVFGNCRGAYIGGSWPDLCSYFGVGVQLKTFMMHGRLDSMSIAARHPTVLIISQT
jgi:hypothetical protein